MPYVMMPVPAEHEEEFGQWLLGVTLRAKLGAWPDGAAAELVASVDDTIRAALVVIAEGGEYFVLADDVASEVGTDVPTLLTGFAAVNGRAGARSWPPLVMVREETDAAGGVVTSLLMNGPTRVQVLAALDRA